jgi:hypothetical protein
VTKIFEKKFKEEEENIAKFPRFEGFQSLIT